MSWRSFVWQKAHKSWIWTAMDARTRQVIAFHVGDRSRECHTVVGEDPGGVL